MDSNYFIFSQDISIIHNLYLFATNNSNNCKTKKFFVYIYKSFKAPENAGTYSGTF